MIALPFVSIAVVFSYLSSLLGGYVLASLIIYPIWMVGKEFFEGSTIAKPLISQNLCTNSGFNIFGNIFQYIGMAMIASVMLSILAYMIGVIFGNQKLKTYMKTEFMDLMLTFGVIIAALGLLYLPCNLTIISFTSAPQKVDMNAYEAAFFFLHFAEHYSYLAVTFSIIMGISVLMVLKAFISNNIFGGIALPVFSGLSLMVKPALSNTIMASTLSYILYSMQVLLYEFLTYGSIKYLVPVGILFRAFSPLKKVGGILIGFAIGATLFYTLVLDLSWYIATPYMPYLKLTMNGETDDSYNIRYDVLLLDSNNRGFYESVFTAPEIYEDIEKEAENLNDQYVGQDNSDKDYSRNFYLLNPAEWAEKLVNKILDKAEPAVRGIFRWIFSSCGTFTILLLIIPILNFLVVITGVRFFSRFLGMDLDISNLTRVV